MRALEESTDRLPDSLGSEVVVRAVCDAFGWPPEDAHAVVVGRGAMGRVWKLTAAGRAYAVKEMLWDEGWLDAAGEVRFRDAAVAAGVRAPDAIALGDGEYVLRLPESSGGLRYRAYSWSDGTTVSGTAARAGAADWLGRTLGQLHSLRLQPVAPPDDWYEVIPDLGELEALLTAARHGDPAGSGERIAELAAMVTPADPDARILCHLDVKPANVLEEDTGRSLIDWDDFGAAMPNRELASVLMRWYAEGPDLDVDAAERMLANYSAAGGTVELDASAFAMLCATSINYVHAQASVVVDRSQPREARDFAADELRSAVRLLPDPGVMRKMLSIAARP
ncbi:aminoglycoside phosphotransferase family protein [Phytoactinopolyspora mesophila]|uniref:Phosphotransferase n=1 Tax=Phytoactinopolyspora mesophila TaxID=2650750 RepID=A0A7K3LYV2_9ACTN|nr:aminoglycoside phosphotransferase family protein [Phytoactinopolyspora mesophila]NDL56213.1 phosphotransferase [Phytoactinopolyspora mesophila]